MIWVDLIFSLGSLVSFTIISGALALKLKAGAFQSILQGLLFSVLVVLGMLRPVELAAGVFFDARSVIISLCTLFYGPISFLPLAMLAVLVRLALGGDWALTGVLTVFSSGLLGCLFWFRCRRAKGGLLLRHVAVLAALVHLILLADMLTLPPELRLPILRNVGLPVLLLLMPTMFFLCWLLLLFERSQMARRQASETHALLENLLEHANAPIVVWSPDFIIQRCNKALEVLLKRPRDQLVGQPLQSLFAPHQRTLIMQLLQDSMQGSLLENLELGMADSLNEIHIVRWNSATVIAADGSKPLAGIAQGVEITDLKNSELLLRSKELTWRNYIDNAPIGIMVLDRFGKIREANRCCTEIVGWERPDLIGLSIIRLVSHLDKPSRRRQLEALLVNGQDQAELVILGRSGKIKTVTVSAAALAEQAAILFINDISEKKTIEAVMRAVASSTMSGQSTIFRFLVVQLAAALGTAVALIAEIQNPHDFTVKSLAVCQDGQILENFSFRLSPVLLAGVMEPINLPMADPLAALGKEAASDELQYLLPGMTTYWGLPLYDSFGAICGLLAVLSNTFFELTPASQNILQVFAARVLSELERQQTEQKYQVLFSQMQEGFAIHEFVVDTDGTPVDYRFLAVNPAFEQMTGLSAGQLLGRTVREVLPRTEQYWIDQYARVALLGENLEFEAYSQNLNRFFYTSAFQTQYRQFACVVTDITDRKIHETEIKQSLREKEILLKEIHHRVKNNLNIIASLLNLQSGRALNGEAALAAFQNSRDQIMSMALVHEELYQSSDYSNVNMPSFINRIKNNLTQIYRSDKTIQIRAEIQDVSLDVNIAIPCSLILNEFITNSYKYAFAGRAGGEISIFLKRQDYDTIVLEYADNGIGLPQEIDFSKTGSLGLTLVRLLAEQIDAELTVENVDGLRYQLRIPNQPEIQGKGGECTDG